MNNRASVLKQQIFKCDPYTGFSVEGLEFDPHGWFDAAESYSYLFDMIRPQTYLELGVWKGKSARWCADKMKSLGVDDPVVIAVDTWQGSIEHWEGTEKSKTKFGALNLQNGYPMFYFTFLANTIISGHHDIIVPFPTTTLTAMRYLKKLGVQAEIIAIDASHEYPEVYDDLVMAATLLKDKNSIIIGDDLSPWFPDVAKSLKQFQAEHPGWRMIKDGFGFILLQPDCDLAIKLPKKPTRKERKAEKERLSAAEK